jgi:hypothetical protein
MLDCAAGPNRCALLSSFQRAVSERKLVVARLAQWGGGIVRLKRLTKDAGRFAPKMPICIVGL